MTPIEWITATVYIAVVVLLVYLTKQDPKETISTHIALAILIALWPVAVPVFLVFPSLGRKRTPK